MTAPSTPPPRTVLGLVFLTVFLDLIGFSILFPLFPDLLSHYLAREGPDSLVGRLHGTLAGWIGGRGDAEFAVVVLFGGVLGSLYSGLQFLFAPLWGGLSDRIGRRPTLLLTLGGTACAYLLWLFSGSFLVLVLSRVLGGIMAGNIATASAVIADVSPPERRTANMAIVGIAVGLGFVLGPAVGALAYYGISLPSDWFGAGDLALNPFSGAALAALVLAMVNLLWAWRRFPETRPVRGSAAELRTRNPFAGLARLGDPGVRRTNVVYLLYQTCFAAMEFTLVFLAAERFAYGPRDNAVMFVFIGLTIALVQGGFVRRSAGRIGERPLAVAGLALLIPGFLAVGLSSSQTALYLGLFLLASGSAIAFPTLSALVSLYAPDRDQGLALGVFRSMGALSRAIGPVLGGLAYWSAGGTAPYLAGAALLVVPLLLATRLPAVPGRIGSAS